MTPGFHFLGKNVRNKNWFAEKQIKKDKNSDENGIKYMEKFNRQKPICWWSIKKSKNFWKIVSKSWRKECKKEKVQNQKTNLLLALSELKVYCQPSMYMNFIIFIFTANWVISPEESNKNEAIFNNLKPNAGKISGEDEWQSLFTIEIIWVERWH